MVSGHRLRLLSYNIQSGIASDRYRHYITKSWRHVLPHADRWTNLKQIADRLSGYDLVGLQETDAGSLRTSFINQTEYLAAHSGFPFWYDQTNRKLGQLARHSNGVLSRWRPREVREYRLPGLHGRGALFIRFGSRGNGLAVFIVHLALGPLARARQIAFLCERIKEHPLAIVMGDLNCSTSNVSVQQMLDTTGLHAPSDTLSTFPSWRPRRSLDHILISRELEMLHVDSPDWAFSDHRPVAMEILVPEQVALTR